MKIETQPDVIFISELEVQDAIRLYVLAKTGRHLLSPAILVQGSTTNFRGILLPEDRPAPASPVTLEEIQRIRYAFT